MLSEPLYLWFVYLRCRAHLQCFCWYLECVLRLAKLIILMSFACFLKSLFISSFFLHNLKVLIYFLKASTGKGCLDVFLICLKISSLNVSFWGYHEDKNLHIVTSFVLYMSFFMFCLFWVFVVWGKEGECIFVCCDFVCFFFCSLLISDFSMNCSSGSWMSYTPLFLFVFVLSCKSTFTFFIETCFCGLYIWYTSFLMLFLKFAYKFALQMFMIKALLHKAVQFFDTVHSLICDKHKNGLGCLHHMVLVCRQFVWQGAFENWKLSYCCIII